MHVCGQKMNLNLFVRTHRNEFWHHCARITQSRMEYALKHESMWANCHLRWGVGGGEEGVGWEPFWTTRGFHSGNSCRQEEQFVIDRQLVNRRGRIPLSWYRTGSALLVRQEGVSVCGSRQEGPLPVSRAIILLLTEDRRVLLWFVDRKGMSTEWSSALEWTGELGASQWTGRSLACPLSRAKGLFLTLDRRD